MLLPFLASASHRGVLAFTHFPPVFRCLSDLNIGAAWRAYSVAMCSLPSRLPVLGARFQQVEPRKASKIHLSLSYILVLTFSSLGLWLSPLSHPLFFRGQPARLIGPLQSQKANDIYLSLPHVLFLTFSSLGLWLSPPLLHHPLHCSQHD